MNKFNVKSLLAVLLTLAMVISIVPMFAVSAEDATLSYVKVTQAPADWSGEYLIVYEDGENTRVLNGGLTKIDAEGNYIKVAAVDGVIEANDTTNAAKFTVEKYNNGYSIKSASGYYMGNTSDQNKIVTNQSTKYENTLTLKDDGTVDVVSAGSHLRSNIAATNGNRFRYYKSATYTGQQAICLYKLEAVGADTPDTPDPCTHATTEIVGKVEATETTEGYTGDTKCTACGEIIATGEKTPVIVPETPADKVTATVVTDIASLKVGDKIVVLNIDGTHALGAHNSGNYRNAIDCAAADGSVSVSADMSIVTLEAGASAGTFALKTDEGYLCFSGSSNKVFVQANVDASASWTLTMSDNAVKIQNVNTPERYLQYNGNANQWRFACYKGTQNDVVFYVVASSDTPDTPACTHTNTEIVGAKDATETEKGYTGDTVCKDCGETVATGKDIPVIVNDPAADSTLSVKDAIALGASKEHNTYTAGKYYVVGEITEVYNTTYGNMKIKDAEGNILTVYGTYSADGSTRYDAMAVKPVAGDTVKVYGIIGQYNGTAQMKNGWIIEHTVPSTPDTTEPETNLPTTEPEAPESNVITAPVAGVPYKFGMVQGNLNKTYYLKGGMDGYYMATTENIDEAIDLFLEETNGGYYLYTMVDGVKTYINMVVSGTHVNGAYEATASTVYKWSAEKNTLMAEVNGADYWFGTRNDKEYTTAGPCAVSYNGFFCQFYPSSTVIAPDTDEPAKTGDATVMLVAIALIAGAALVVGTRKRRFN